MGERGETPVSGLHSCCGDETAEGWRETREGEEVWETRVMEREWAEGGEWVRGGQRERQDREAEVERREGEVERYNGRGGGSDDESKGERRVEREARDKEQMEVQTARVRIESEHCGEGGEGPAYRALYHAPSPRSERLPSADILSNSCGSRPFSITLLAHFVLGSGLSIDTIDRGHCSFSLLAFSRVPRPRVQWQIGARVSLSPSTGVKMTRPAYLVSIRSKIRPYSIRNQLFAVPKSERKRVCHVRATCLPCFASFSLVSLNKTNQIA